MICSKCGYVALDGDVFCIKCGNPLNQPEPAVQEEAQPVADEIREEVIEAAKPAPEVFEEAEAVKEEVTETVVEPVEEVEEQVEAIEEAVETAPVEETKRDLFAVKTPKSEEEVPVSEAEPEPEEEKPEEAPAVETVVCEDPDAQENDEPEEEETEAPKKPRRSILTRIERPLSVWGFFWRTVLFAIPVVNIIPLFVFAFAPGINKNSKNYASAILILLLIGLIVSVIVGFLVFSSTDPTVLHDFILKYFKISI
ncbi:MAG: zinc ribbon domain-containing protein [Clostridiales bacterium]|nr:zinc ribbon domain-containing protein [Clostridiales bacterium]